MKVTHLNTYTEGGAAEAALRLHCALLNGGIESKFLALYKGRCELNKVYDFRTELNKINYWFTKFKNKAHTLASASISKASGEWYSDLNTVWKAEQHSLVKAADIVHLHWISNYVNLPTFLAQNKKIVFTLHDHFLFSGGFHYPPPKKGIVPEKTLEKQKQIIKNLLSENPINIVCPSEHLKNLAQDSGILSQCSFTVIKNPVDTEIFKPQDKTACRKILNVPADKKVLFFLSDYLNYERKGFSVLEKALSQLNEEVTLIVAGRGKIPENIGMAHIKHFGLVRDKTLLNNIYGACDVLVNPSLNDISSNTVIEAMACGRPAIAFHSGGIPELITEVNGLIANDKTPEALASVINNALKKDFDAVAIRNKAIQEHSLNLIAAKYIELYRKVAGK